MKKEIFLTFLIALLSTEIISCQSNINRTEISTVSCNSIKINRYMKKMNIPADALVIIVNLKYPCGNCLNHVLNEMHEHHAEYQKAKIYYILYDINDDKFATNMLKNFHLLQSPIVKIDTQFLSQIIGKSAAYSQYCIIENTKEKQRLYMLTFDEFMPLFQELTAKKLGEIKK
ncbi:MAG: hypothetical protein LBR36_04190 [Bacteroidales bacterium]|jgi:hypothetical protein|nr:hypothetical protein [Bacteroidales bacterium]